eukprot:13664745-Ditylum_brightwellii.AAC.1
MTIGEQIQFLHEAVGSPVPSTWIDAINRGFFITWPGLTADNVRKYFPKSRATSQGHLEQKWQNIASTKRKETETTEQENTLEVPKQEEDNMKTNVVYAIILEEGRIYTDQTGRFPVSSSRGSKYIMVLYCYNEHAILAEPIKTDQRENCCKHTIKCTSISKTEDTN